MRMLLVLLLSGLAFAQTKPDLLKASVIGEVRHQGKFNLTPGATVLDLLLQAGGTAPKADLETVVLMRGDRVIPLDLRPAQRDNLKQILLQSGDLLVVNPAMRLGVTGEVREPGIYAVSFKSPKPIEALLQAAGGTKETAALQRILLVRPTLPKPIVIDLNRPVTETLQDGDIISVLPLRCVVIGGVDKPGQIVLTGNETLFDVVSASGTSRGRLDQVVVMRAADVEAGNDKRETYDLTEAFTELKSIPKVPIYDGDVICVPPTDGPQPPLPIYPDPRYRPGYYDRVMFPIGL